MHGRSARSPAGLDVQKRWDGADLRVGTAEIAGTCVSGSTRPGAMAVAASVRVEHLWEQAEGGVWAVGDGEVTMVQRGYL